MGTTADKRTITVEDGRTVVTLTNPNLDALEHGLASLERFVADVVDPMREGLEQIVDALPEADRDTFLDLPMDEGMAFAEKRLRPAARAPQCARTVARLGARRRAPRARARRERRRASRSSRAGPDPDSDEPVCDRRHQHDLVAGAVA
jgi:hypothetical protein